MKELKNIVKFLMVVLIGVMLIVSTAKITYASSDDLFFSGSTNNEEDKEDEDEDENDEEDDDDFETIAGPSSNTNTNDNNTNTNNNVNNTLTNTNNNTNTSNRSVSNSNSLAKTGISDHGSIIAVVLVICGVSAVYSIRKMNDYKNRLILKKTKSKNETNKNGDENNPSGKYF